MKGNRYVPATVIRKKLPLRCQRQLGVFYLAALLLVPPLTFAADFTGKVVGVTDGDTLTVLHEGKGEKVRLKGIDCPERGQPFSKKAKKLASTLVFGKEVTITTHGSDKYGRIIGDVILPDERILTQELIRAGLCWWYRKYSDDTQLADDEHEARKAKLGLWTDPEPIPPWFYRKLKRGKALVPTELPHPIAPPSVQPFMSTNPPIIGNRRSHIYHRPDCPNYDDVSERNRIPFGSVHDAETAGFRLAKNCPY